jgi:hypothetical protein
MKRAYMPAMVFLWLYMTTIVFRTVISTRVKNGVATGQVKNVISIASRFSRWSLNNVNL